MPFSGNTTIITTEGIKKLKDLVDKPFKAIINDQVYPCHAGVTKNNKGDLYLLKTSKGRLLLTTLDQQFVSQSGVFTNIQEFRYNHKFYMASSVNPTFTGNDNDPLVINRSSEGIRSYIKELYTDNYTGKPLVTLYNANYEYLPTPTLQGLLYRLGIAARIRKAAKQLRVVYIREDCTQGFLDYIHNKPRAPLETPLVTLFRRLEYYETAPTYTCEIEIAQSYDAEGFYVQGSG